MTSLISRLRWISLPLLVCLTTLPPCRAQLRQLTNRSGVTVEKAPYPYDGVQSLGQNVYAGTNWSVNPQGVNALTFHNCGYSAIPSYANEPIVLPNCQVEASLWTESGWNRGNLYRAEHQGWFVSSHRLDQVSCYSVGICGGNTLSALKVSGGDFSGLNQYIQCTSSWITPSDEGCVAARNNIVEPGAMLGTVTEAAAGTGTTQMIVNCSSNCAMIGAQRPLINKTTGVISASVTHISVEKGLGTLTLAGVKLPPPSVCGTIAADVQTPGTKIDQKVPGQQISLTGLASALVPGQKILVGQFFLENTTIKSVGSFHSGAQTITVPLSFPYIAGGFVCTGGLTGYAMEEPKYTQNGSRPLWQVVSSTASSITVTQTSQQGIVASTASLNSDTVNLYPSAIVINSGNASTYRSLGNPSQNAPETGTLFFSLDPNTAVWNAGDSVELAELVSQMYVGSTVQTSITNTLAYVIGNSSAVEYNYAKSARMFMSANYGKNPTLFNHGGVLFPPTLSFAAGVHGAGMVFTNYLESWADESGNIHSACALCFIGGWASGGNLKSFDIFRDETKGPGAITYYPSDGKMDFVNLGIQIPAIKAKTGTRFVCVDTAGNLISQTTPCSGT